MADKRLRRTTGSDKVIAGVCGGLGNYFGIDPVIIRILFVVGVLVFNISPLLYLILWIVMPQE